MTRFLPLLGSLLPGEGEDEFEARVAAKTGGRSPAWIAVFGNRKTWVSRPAGVRWLLPYVSTLDRGLVMRTKFNEE